MTKWRKTLIAFAASVALALGFSFGPSVTTSSASPGDVVYQSCSTDHAITTDDNGVRVICEDWPLGTSSKWMPLLLDTTTMPTVSELDLCYIPGLQAKKSGSPSNILECSRHFSGYVYWDHS